MLKEETGTNQTAGYLRDAFKNMIHRIKRQRDATPPPEEAAAGLIEFIFTFTYEFFFFLY